MNRQYVIDNSLDLMEELKQVSNETIGLALFEPDCIEGEVITAITGNHSFNFKPEIGHRFPLHSTAPGKAFLATLPTEKLDKILTTIKLENFTEKTISNISVLKKELQSIRSQGFATDLQEAVNGLNCIGCAIRDANNFPVAAIWITGPTNRLSETKLKEFSPKLITTALEISARICSKNINKHGYRDYVINLSKEYMWNHSSENIDMSELANKMCVQYCWFRRNFKNCTGLSPNQYFMQLKLDRAKRLLKHTELPVKEIANQLNYKTQDYFSAIFKKKTGLSPANFRLKNTNIL